MPGSIVDQKNSSKAFAHVQFTPTFAAPISSFENPLVAEMKNPAKTGLGDQVIC